MRRQAITLYPRGLSQDANLHRWRSMKPVTPELADEVDRVRSMLLACTSRALSESLARGSCLGRSAGPPPHPKFFNLVGTPGTPRSDCG